MRHRVHHRKLNRTMEHRWALRRNMTQSLLEHGEIRTTIPKAKDLRPFAERLITLAVRLRKYDRSNDKAASLRARRAIHRLLGDRAIIPKEHADDYNMMSDAQRDRTLRMQSGRRHRTGQPKGKLAFTAESVIHRLIEDVAPRFEDRAGGYTRVIRLAQRRVGDSSQLAVLQLLGEEESPGPVSKPKKTARRKRADARYRLAAQLAKQSPAKPAADAPKDEPKAAEAENVGGETEEASEEDK